MELFTLESVCYWDDLNEILKLRIIMHLSEAGGSRTDVRRKRGKYYIGEGKCCITARKWT